MTTSLTEERGAASTILARRDLSFLLYEWLDVERLSERDRYAHLTRDLYDDVLELAERIATERFASHSRSSDENEPELHDGAVTLIPEIGDALAAFSEAGFLSATADEDLGGMQLPQTVGAACSAWFLAANVATTGYAFLSMAAANTLLATADAEQVERWARPLLEGRFFGTMCISEPHAGSSVGDAATRAVREPDGTFRIFGSKMWISGGEHEMGENIVHLVLARLPDAPAGSKGISLFIVPRNLVDADGSVGPRNDVTLAGLNHKMGSRGTVNTVLGFGEGVHPVDGRPGAVGYLVGEPNKGLPAMFHMMNEARLGVGMCAAALGYTGYLRALQYARERLQGRPAGAGSATAQVAIIEHPDVRRMLLAQKAYAEGAMALLLYCSRLLDEQQTALSPAEEQRARMVLDVLTPIAKSWPSQWCLEANSLAIQVHGGYGYARDYGIEQLYRDNRLNAIHEGTHGIQALDLVGRKVRLDGGAAFAAVLQVMRDSVAHADRLGGEAAELGAQLRKAVYASERVLKRAPDPDAILANASAYMEAFGHVVIAWVWLEQFLACTGRHGDFYDGKRQAARFFFAHELPKTAAQFALVEQGDRAALDMDPAWF
jgi:butyryl-CoA dehydrogenase